MNVFLQDGVNKLQQCGIFTVTLRINFQTTSKLLPVSFLSSSEKIFDNHKTLINTAIQNIFCSNLYTAEVPFNKEE